MLALLIAAFSEFAIGATTSRCVSENKALTATEVILVSGLNAEIDLQRHRLDAAIKRAGISNLKIRSVELDEFRADSIGEQLRVQQVSISGPVVTLSGIIANGINKEGAPWPVIFTSLNDPVEARLISSLGPRQENATGISFAVDLEWKALEHLKLAFPDIRSVGILLDNFSSRRPAYKRLSEEANHRLSLQVSLLVAETPNELSRLLATNPSKHVDAWYVPETTVILRHEDSTVSALLELRKPALFGHPSLLKKGAVMVFGAEFSSIWDEIAQMVRLVCSGTPAREIPIVRPHRIFLGASAANAKRLGLELNPRIFKLATIIE